MKTLACTRRSRPPTARPFTLIELLVVVAIISVLAAMLLPALGKARDQAKRTACLNCLKQLGTGLQTYMDDYDGEFAVDKGTGGDNNYSMEFWDGYPQAAGNWQNPNWGLLAVNSYLGPNIEPLFCPAMEWADTQFYCPREPLSRWVFLHRAQSYSFGSYTSPKFIIRHMQLNTNDYGKLSTWEGNPAVAFDGMQDAYAVVRNNPQKYAVGHHLRDFNALSLDGSCRGWYYSRMTALSLSERNTNSDGAYHPGTIQFWQLISPGFKLH